LGLGFCGSAPTPKPQIPNPQSPFLSINYKLINKQIKLNLFFID